MKTPIVLTEYEPQTFGSFSSHKLDKVVILEGGVVEGAEQSTRSIILRLNASRIHNFRKIAELEQNVKELENRIEVLENEIS
jgi:hypothetical protein